MEFKDKSNTMQEYLEKNLYPSLKVAINELVNHIRDTEIFPELVREFNQNFFENKAKVTQKEKELLKLERGSDYSESDYDYFMRINMDLNETNSENKIEEIKEEFDPDFDDSDMLHLAEQELDEDEEEENEEKFNPIIFLANELRKINLNKKSTLTSLNTDIIDL